MTRRPQDTRPARRSGRDPYRVGRAAPFLAPLLSMAGLLVIAVVTLFALTGRVPFLGSPTAIGGGGNVPAGPDAVAERAAGRQPCDPGPGFPRVCQGGQPLDPVRQRRSPAHEHGPGFAADVVAGWQLGLLHRDARDGRQLPGPGNPEALRPQVPGPDARSSRRDRPRGGPLRPLQDRARRRVHLVLVHPRSGRLARWHPARGGLRRAGSNQGATSCSSSWISRRSGW